jgi:hypothetical protein
MRSPHCLYICVPVGSPRQLLKQLSDIHGIQQRGHAIEGGLEDIMFNAVASSIK